MASIETVSLSASPAEGQVISHDSKTYTTIREGLAYILIPVDSSSTLDPKLNGRTGTVNSVQQPTQSVFYNPIQQFNRDLSVLSIKAFGEDLCERRRAKWERNYEKLARRKKFKQEKKRQREANGSADIASKRPREEDSSGAVVTAEQIDTTYADCSNKVEVDSVRDAEAIRLLENTDVDDEVMHEDLGVNLGVHATIDDRAKTEQSSNGARPSRPSFRILDALSATGLRALRYAREIPFATSITANDMDRTAVRSIEMHLKHNKLNTQIRATTFNALAHMYQVAHPPHDSHGPNHLSEKYDVIDLDPYGTAAPFLDAAVQALNDGGLLCVTCTDSAVFASCGYSEKTFSLYGGLPTKAEHCHETALRLVLHAIATTAARYGIAIEPLLSLSIDYYVRLFVRIRRSPADTKFLAGKIMLVHECDVGCGAWATQLLGRNTKRPGKGDNVLFKHSIEQSPSTDRHCEHCGSKMHIAGPMWAGPLHHPGFVSKVIEDAKAADKKVYETTTRIEGMLSTALDELLDTSYVAEPGIEQSSIPKVAPEQLDQQPFFFLPSRVAKVLHTSAPPEAALKGALRHAGYRASRSHCKPGSIKTNASWSAIWDIMREWVRQRSPVAKDRYRPGSPGWKIMGYDVPVPADSSQAQPPAQKDDTDQTLPPIDEADQTDASGAQIPTNETVMPKLKIHFDEVLGRDKPGKRLVRYQLNPRENWGPMSRAK